MTAGTDAVLLAFFLAPFVALAVSCYIARLAGGSWGWAAWGIFGPLGWIAAFALSGSMRAHEAADRRECRRPTARRSAARRASVLRHRARLRASR